MDGSSAPKPDQEGAKALRVVEEARARGMDITTEMYPYTAGMNRIESVPWDEWAEHPERFTDADF
jgi:hypothetical protein